jgi:hypothetical protein
MRRSREELEAARLPLRIAVLGECVTACSADAHTICANELDIVAIAIGTTGEVQ